MTAKFASDHMKQQDNKIAALDARISEIHKEIAHLEKAGPIIPSYHEVTELRKIKKNVDLPSLEGWSITASDLMENLQRIAKERNTTLDNLYLSAGYNDGEKSIDISYYYEEMETPLELARFNDTQKSILAQRARQDYNDHLYHLKNELVNLQRDRAILDKYLLPSKPTTTTIIVEF